MGKKIFAFSLFSSDMNEKFPFFYKTFFLTLFFVKPNNFNKLRVLIIIFLNISIIL